MTSFNQQTIKMPRPPWIFFVFLLIGLLCEQLLGHGLTVSTGAAKGTAIALSLFSGAMAIAAIRTLHHHNTTHSLKEQTSMVVDSGPYRFTRNPMYLALVLLLLAAVILFWSIYLLAAATGLWLALDRLIIVPEERYLQSAFPQEYTDYQSKVSRWL